MTFFVIFLIWFSFSFDIFQSPQYIELRNSDAVDNNVRASRLYLEATDNNFLRQSPPTIVDNHSDHDSVDDQSAQLLLNNGGDLVEKKDRPKSKG